MQTTSNINIFTVLAKKHYGKTTVGKYILEVINKPSIVVDIAMQFDANSKYKKVVKGLNELKFFLTNKHFKNAFYKSKMQLIYRFTTDDKQKEALELFKFLNENMRNITIFCEEMELYANQYLKMKSPIFETIYLARNYGFDVIVICKVAGQLSPLIKMQTDYFIVNTNDINATKYLNERSNQNFAKKAKDLKKREFLLTDLDDLYYKFKLNETILKLIK